jgi:hypothetical protein
MDVATIKPSGCVGRRGVTSFRSRMPTIPHTWARVSPSSRLQRGRRTVPIDADDIVADDVNPPLGGPPPFTGDRAEDGEQEAEREPDQHPHDLGGAALRNEVELHEPDQDGNQRDDQSPDSEQRAAAQIGPRHERKSTLVPPVPPEFSPAPADQQPGHGCSDQLRDHVSWFQGPSCYMPGAGEGRGTVVGDGGQPAISDVSLNRQSSEGHIDSSLSRLTLVE